MKKLIKKILPPFLIDRYHILPSFLGALFYHFPGKQTKIIGVTGTNGKSTVVNLVKLILEKAGFKVAVASSISFKIGQEEWPNTLRMTMMGGFQLQKFLRRAISSNCQYVVLEVTSEGIKQYRHKFIDFSVAVLTNLTPEHIEAHGGFENYKRAKGKLFQATKGIHVINWDDEHKDYFLQFLAKQKKVFTIENSEPKASTKLEKIAAKSTRVSERGVKFFVNDTEFSLNLLGRFNIYNALAAISVALSQGISLKTCQKALEKAEGIPGRMEEVISQPFKVIVDYAFTPNALEKVYQTLRNNFKPKRMICILGSCGGGRDKWKRPTLGELAAKHCNKVIVTNEDPYDEDPMEIIEQVARGAKGKAKKILDRREAISKALQIAETNDLVVITGKGCEPSICLGGGKKIAWDDRKVVKGEFQKLVKEKK